MDGLPVVVASRWLCHNHSSWHTKGKFRQVGHYHNYRQVSALRNYGHHTTGTLSKDTDKFVSELPEKVQAKIAYNIRRIECGAIDEDIFKYLKSETQIFRRLEQYIIADVSVCLPSGTQDLRLWLS